MYLSKFKLALTQKIFFAEMFCVFVPSAGFDPKPLV